MGTDGQHAGATEPVFVLEGQLVALGPLDSSMTDLWTGWMNDLEVTRTLGAMAVNIHTREDEQRYYDRVTQSDSDVSFAIYELNTKRPIGTASLKEVNYRVGTASFGILIGERSCWNRGYGTEATRLVLDYAFHALGLHNVLLTVFATNPRGQRAYEKAGFREIGRRREAYKLGQRRYDIVLMDALVSDFESPVLARRLHEPQPPKGP